jgi:hypothetical protein
MEKPQLPVPAPSAEPWVSLLREGVLTLPACGINTGDPVQGLLPRMECEMNRSLASLGFSICEMGEWAGQVRKLQLAL